MSSTLRGASTTVKSFVGVLGCTLQPEYEPAPLVLAFVLGRMAEESLRQALLLSRGSAAVLFARPLAVGILAAAIGTLVIPALLPAVRARLARLRLDEG